MNRPSPLVPANVDLTDFDYIPLEVRRLRDSGIVSKTSGEEFKAAVLLWCASWHQVPAASIPDDDSEMALLAGFGRVIKEWRKVKDGALHGWVLCSDGRWYHPVIADKALEAWDAKQLQRWGRECDRLRKENKKLAESGMETLPFPVKPTPVSGGKGARTVSGKAKSAAGFPAENALKREGEGKREGESSSSSGTGSSGGTGMMTVRRADALNEDSPARRITDRFLELRTELWPTESAFPAPSLTILSQAEEFLGGDATLEPLILEVMERTMRAKAEDGERAPGSLKAYRLTIGDAIRNHRRPTKPEREGAPAAPAAKKLTAAEMTPHHWRLKLDDWTKRHRSNPDRWTGPGSAPGQQDCLCPAEIQREFGFEPCSETEAAA